MGTRVRSFAKVNLGLRIGPVRADGYHELMTLYQTIRLHDFVTVTARPAGATRIVLRTNDPRVPVDARNTVWGMVERALAAARVTAEVEVEIEKRLPVQGGLGAGSANAAAALLGLERQLGVRGGDAGWLSGAERLRLAGEVGSDVPLFLVGGTVLGFGRGELVAAMPDVCGGNGLSCVVAVPKVGVSTPMAFRRWDEKAARLTETDLRGRLEVLCSVYADAYAGATAAATPTYSSEQSSTGQRASVLDRMIRSGLENDFEEIAFSIHAALRATKRVLMGEGGVSGARYAALSGSGSALFGVYDRETAATEAQQRVQRAGDAALRTRTVTRAEYWSTVFVEEKANGPGAERLD